jgi:hypothetical protein
MYDERKRVTYDFIDIFLLLGCGVYPAATLLIWKHNLVAIFHRLAICIERQSPSLTRQTALVYAFRW